MRVSGKKKDFGGLGRTVARFLMAPILVHSTAS